MRKQWSSKITQKSHIFWILSKKCLGVGAETMVLAGHLLGEPRLRHAVLIWTKKNSKNLINLHKIGQNNFETLKWVTGEDEFAVEIGVPGVDLAALHRRVGKPFFENWFFWIGSNFLGQNLESARNWCFILYLFLKIPVGCGESRRNPS